MIMTIVIETILITTILLAITPSALTITIPCTYPAAPRQIPWHVSLPVPIQTLTNYILVQVDVASLVPPCLHTLAQTLDFVGLIVVIPQLPIPVVTIASDSTSHHYAFVSASQ